MKMFGLKLQRGDFKIWENVKRDPSFIRQTRVEKDNISLIHAENIHA